MKEQTELEKAFYTSTLLYDGKSKEFLKWFTNEHLEERFRSGKESFLR
jgi:hypothetical protein